MFQILTALLISPYVTFAGILLFRLPIMLDLNPHLIRSRDSNFCLWLNHTPIALLQLGASSSLILEGANYHIADEETFKTD